MRNILVNYSPNEDVGAVVDSALHITKGYDAKITFVYIGEKISKEANMAQSRLQQIVSDRKLPADKIKYVLKEGKTYVEIVNVAKEHKNDVIVMRVAPKPSIFNVFSENNPYQAIISAPCPVVTMGKGVKLDKVQQILLPIDDTDLTRQKLPMACNIAKHFGATIHLLALCEDTSGRQKIRMQNYAEQSKRFVQEKGINTTYDVVLGKKICNTVLEFEEKSNADLIIVTADEDTSFLVESIFEKVIRKSSIPVMSIPPKETKVVWAGM